MNNFHELYQSIIKEASTQKSQEKSSTKNPIVDSYQALSVRLQNMQCRLISTYLLIQNSTKIIYPLVEKHKGFLKTLSSRTFVRESSMLKHFPNEPTPTYTSTFKHIANSFKSINVEMREIISVFNLQWYGPGYKYMANPGLLELVDQFAPFGLVSSQTDLYYLFRSFVNKPELTPKQDIQWDHYIRDSSELINLILTYPNPNWNLLLRYMCTQKINIPVNQFFARSNPTNKVEPLSNRTFALYVDCSNRFISLLHLILLTNILEHSKAIQTKDIPV